MLSAKGNASFFGFGPRGAARMDFSGRERKKLFCNAGGKKLVDVSYFGGIDSAQDGRSVAIADLDHDGVPEMIVAMRDTPLFHIWKRGAAETHGHALALDVRGDGKGSSTDAIGAQVTASCKLGSSSTAGGPLGGGAQKMTRIVAAGTGFAAQDSHTLVIGTGACEKVELVVRWPSKLEKTFHDVKTDEKYTVNEETLHNVPGYLQKAAAPATKAALPASSASHAFLDAVDHGAAHTASGPSSFTASKDVVYVDFWASWCEACKRNQPAIDALATRFHDRVDFVGVTMDPEDGENVVAEHAKSAAYPLMGGKTLIAAATPLVGDKPALPTTMLVARKSGAILWKGAGVPTISDLEASLDRAR